MQIYLTQTLAAVAACILLAACQSEQPAKGEALAKLQNQCLAYGFKLGTPSYSSCLMQLDQSRIQTNIAKRQAFGAALQNMGSNMQQSAGNSVNCTSYRVGNTVQTRCY